MDWNDLRYFLALARSGSVRAAGASLGVSHSTVLRRVEALEERLGTRLFDRSRGGYTLTQAGQEMVPGAERIEDEMAALERGLVGKDAQLEGDVSITCCDPWVADLLLRELRGFCHNNPGIQLHVGADGRPFDLSKREADIAIRALARSKQPPQHLIGTRVAALRMANYVAIEHADRLDPDREGSDARWASFDDPDIQTELAGAGSYAHLQAWGGFSSLTVLVSAVKAGYGIAMLPSYVGDSEPSLRRLSHDDDRHLGDLWLLSHPDLRSNARLKACRQAISRAFDAQSWLFDGDGRQTHPPVA